MAELERLHWLLDSPRFASPVEEAVINALREPVEKFECVGRHTWGQEFTGPATQLVSRVGLMAFDAVSEVRHLVGAILDRKGPWDVLEVEVCGVQGRMLDAYGALDAQIFCAIRKPRDSNMIAESVLNETQARRLRTNLEVRLNDWEWESRGRSIIRCSPRATGRR